MISDRKTKNAPSGLPPAARRKSISFNRIGDAFVSRSRLICNGRPLSPLTGTTAMSLTKRNRNRLDIDFSEASRHCQLLDPRDVPHIFATLPEAPGATHHPQQFYGRLKDVAERLNDAQQEGCAVHVAANRMHGTQRRASDVAQIRTVQRDVDQTPVPELPLASSLIISTSPDRWQDYVFTDPDDPLSVEEAERINRILAKEYGGDPHASDTARLLRLAGTWHLKDDPYRAHIAAGDGRRYKRAEFDDAFPIPPPRQSPCAMTIPASARHDNYVAGAVRNLVAELAKAKQGHRNATLNWCAFRLGQLGLGFEECATWLTPVAMQIGLPEREVKSTIRSGWHAGAANDIAGRVLR